MQNGVPKTFRTPFLKSSKTKTKTKYLILTSCGSSVLKKLWRQPASRHLSDRRVQDVWLDEI